MKSVFRIFSLYRLYEFFLTVPCVLPVFRGAIP